MCINLLGGKGEGEREREKKRRRLGSEGGEGKRNGWEEGNIPVGALQTTHAQFDFRIPPMCGRL